MQIDSFLLLYWVLLCWVPHLLMLCWVSLCWELFCWVLLHWVLFCWGCGTEWCYAGRCYAEWHYVGCHFFAFLNIIMLIVVMLSVVAPKPSHPFLRDNLKKTLKLSFKSLTSLNYGPKIQSVITQKCLKIQCSAITTKGKLIKYTIPFKIRHPPNPVSVS
jgi:hypothetical protein